MSKVKDLIKKECEESPEFKAEYEKERRIYIIAETMRNYRKQTGLNQTAFARKAGIDRTTLVRIENADLNPMLEIIMRVAQNIGEPIPFDFFTSKETSSTK